MKYFIWGMSIRHGSRSWLENRAKCVKKFCTLPIKDSKRHFCPMAKDIGWAFRIY